MCEQIRSNSFKIKITYKLFTYKSYIAIPTDHRAKKKKKKKNKYKRRTNIWTLSENRKSSRRWRLLF